PLAHEPGPHPLLDALPLFPLHIQPFARPRSLSARRVLRRREFRALGQRQREPACGAIRLPMSRVQDSSSLTRAAGPTHSTGPAALLSLKREIVVGGLSALLVRPATHLGTPPDELTNLDGV